MKKILSILGIAAISFSLFGCQYFQPPAEEVVDREVVDEAVVGDTLEQEATVTILEGEESTLEQEATVTILEGEEGGADGSLDQTATVVIGE